MTKAKVQVQNKDIRIVVLQRGWVVIGTYSATPDEVTVTDGAVIRYWGTTKGLPELIGGPTSTTKLDRFSTPLRAHPLTVLFTIDCDAVAWAKHFGG